MTASYLSTLDQELSSIRDPSSFGSGSYKRDKDGVTVALIDPFLHPFIYNKTLLSHPHRPPKSLSSPPLTDIYTVSPNFCFLPSNVSVSPSGEVQFTSYINNLSFYRYKDTLYRSLSSLATAFLPLLEHVLTDLHRNNPLPQRIPGSCRYTVWDEPDPPEFSDDEDGWATYEREMRHWILHRPIHLPDVPDFGYPGGLEQRKHTVDLKGRNLQVIVQISETRLVSPNYIVCQRVSCSTHIMAVLKRNLEVLDIQGPLGT